MSAPEPHCSPFVLGLIASATLLLAPVSTLARETEDRGNHPSLPSLERIIAAFESGRLDLDDLRALGLSVFATPFNVHDGHGDGPFDPDEWDPKAFGQRPTLQGNGQLLRVNGLDAQSCNECHGFVRNGAPLPVLGIAGVGGMVTNAMIMPTMFDVADSADDRVARVSGYDPDLPLEGDGVADFNGRFANPPALYGGGGKEAVGKEMTADLQALLDVAEASPPGTIVALRSKGVEFGFVRTLGGGALDLSGVEGLTPATITHRDQVVIRPFGRKFENFSMRDFDRVATQFHFGIEPVEVVGEGVDRDGDGHEDEISVAEMSMLHVFDVTNPRPLDAGRGRAARNGFRVFESIGCTDCHVPALTTRSRKLPLAFPEIPTDPSANVYLEIDLVEVGFEPLRRDGVRVPMFSDLKRHDMGETLAESLEGAGEENRFFGTASLWGVADGAPYLHDGRATTLHEAIELHGGEAEEVRDRFLALDDRDQTRLLAFLGSLHNPERPNEELVPIVERGVRHILRRIRKR